MVTKVEHNDPPGWSQPIYDVHLGPEAMALQIPEGFLEAATRVRTRGSRSQLRGNQTWTGRVLHHGGTDPKTFGAGKKGARQYSMLILVVSPGVLGALVAFEEPGATSCACAGWP